MAIRKNKKRIDPRYFLNERAEYLRSEMGKEAPVDFLVQSIIWSYLTNNNVNTPVNAQEMMSMLSSPRGQETIEKYGTTAQDTRLVPAIRDWFRHATRQAVPEEWQSQQASGQRVFRFVDRTDTDYVQSVGVTDDGKIVTLSSEER